MKITRIAVVGAGLAGTTILKKLVRTLPARLDTFYQIDIFESASKVGPGIAYMEPVDSLLLNRTTSRMYACHNGDFLDWMRRKSGNDKTCSNLANQYLPRSLFGEYLKEVFADSIAESKLRNISVTLHRENITDLIEVEKGFKLRLLNSESRQYQYLFITTGNDMSIDHYGLMGDKDFYITQFPMTQYEPLFSNDKVNIGIIGSRLCAVDIAHYLHLRKPSLKLTMLSRQGKVPRSVAPMKFHVLTYFTEQAIVRLLAENDGVIRLNQAKALLQQEIDLHCPGVLLDQIFSEQNSLEKNDKVYQRLYNIFGSTNRVSSQIWRYLPDREKKIFMLRYSSRWMQFRIGVPAQISEKIAAMESEGILTVCGSIRNIERADPGFVATFADGSTRHFDAIVNATGIKRKIDNHSSLLTCVMLLKRLFEQHPLGGVCVNPENCSARVDQKNNDQLKVVGQLTCGEFYMVNNVDIISWQVSLAVDDVCRQIAESHSQLTLTGTE